MMTVVMMKKAGNFHTNKYIYIKGMGEKNYLLAVYMCVRIYKHTQ